MGTTKESVKSFINWYGHVNPLLKITSRGIRWCNHWQYTGFQRWSVQARKITGIAGSEIFDLKENKVNTINNNLPSWVEVEEALEGEEAPEGPEAQEEADAAMMTEEGMSLPERRKQSQGYPKP